MSLYDKAKEQIDIVVAEAKLVVADKQVTLSEVFALATKCIAAFTTIAKELDVPNEEKKKVIMLAFEKLYDEVLGPIDIKSVPNVVEPIVDRMAKSVMLEVISGVVDGLFAILNKE